MLSDKLIFKKFKVVLTGDIYGAITKNGNNDEELKQVGDNIAKFSDILTQRLDYLMVGKTVLVSDPADAVMTIDISDILKGNIISSSEVNKIIIKEE